MTAEGNIVHRKFPILVLIALLFVAGCATTDDLRRVRGDLNQQIRLANDRITGVEQGMVGVKDGTAGILKEVEKANEKTDGAIKSLRGSQAESRAATTELRDQIQQIRGAIDGLKRDISSSSTRTSKREEEEKGLREKLDSLTFKINFLENFLGIGKKDETAADGAVEKNVKPPAPPKEAGGKVRTDKESLYAAAYELFREAKYERSREGFENFLKLHPDTEFSDNAQFWIAECFYFEKKYEKAIVEYDKVVKNYPEGNKVPFALLKQGLSFEKLGDKASAKLLLQQVIRDFPNTSQSRIARTKLLEIK
ncbi:MAG TPA: tol-pal system protein YbgF [Syntrophus sp. (in: bacteria)]|nr:MAG: tol-pal system protein YbgF [Syntrophus sp. GWC2_56_31]HBB15682.1 tol-pal system protein YbgF [Syntrophus sp. (in: bacteria)]